MRQSIAKAVLAGAAAILLASAATADADYPALYREIGLPEFPGATVESTGRDNSKLEDGVRVTVQASASNAELRAYYEDALAALGWSLQETVAAKRMREAGMLATLPFNAVFCRSDGTAFQVTTADLGAARQLDISVTRGANACGQ